MWQGTGIQTYACDVCKSDDVIKFVTFVLWPLDFSSIGNMFGPLHLGAELRGPQAVLAIPPSDCTLREAESVGLSF